MAFPEGFYCASAFCRESHSRGGALIFVKNELRVRVCDVSQFCSEFHFEASAVIVDQLGMIVISLYHSTSGNPDIFIEKLENLLEFMSLWPNHRIVMGGDLNIQFDISKSSRTAKLFKNILRQHNFKFLNKNATRLNNCLDNVFVNNDMDDVLSCRIIPFPYSDHDGILVEIKVKFKSNVGDVVDSSLKLVLPFSARNDLSDNLLSYDWAGMLTQTRSSNANCIFERFFKVLLNNLSYFKVVKKGKNNVFANKSKKWYTAQLAKMKERLLFLSKLRKCSIGRGVESKFKQLKEQYRKEIRVAKCEYNSNILEQSTNKSKAAWKLIKNNCFQVKHERKSDITPDDFNNYFINSVKEIKSHLNLDKIIVTCKELLNKLEVQSNVRFKWKVISQSDIMKAAKRLSNSNSCDVYDISNNILKSLIGSIVEPLCICFNVCLNEGIFPDYMKISRVCPIFKKGSCTQPCNYRPVSIIPVIGKLLEILVYDQLSSFFENNNYLCLEQYGFRKGRSTVDAMDSLVREILTVFEKKAYAQATFCDLSRAFECVSHDILLEKLNYYGVCGIPLTFFKSYLQNRRQKVFLQGQWSGEMNVEWGVPQGSVLGPLLFLICINDLPLSVNSRSLLYADDTTFVNISSSFHQLIENTKSTLLSASEWFLSNGFLLNEDKTKQIIFSLRSIDNEACVVNKIENVLSIKFLGIHFDDHLTWGPHIDYLTTKLSSITYLIRRLTFCVSSSCVRYAYFAYFQSLIRYGLILWGNSSRVSEILILQKKVIRIITKSHVLEHCKPLFILTEIQTVINLYIFDIAQYILSHQEFIHVRQNSIHETRNNNKATIGFHRLSKSLSSHPVICIKVYNKLIHLINKYSPKVFKSKFYSWLLKTPFYSIDEFFCLGSIEF